VRVAADRFPFACHLRSLLAYSPSITNVHFCRVTLALITSCLLASSAYPQSSVTTPPQRPSSDRSFYFDKPVSHPEALSGVWEAPDGKDGAVGIHLQLTTAVSGDADPPVWTPQSWKHLDVGVFQRRGPELEFGEENYFSDDLRGGSVKLEDGRLQLHFISSIRDTPSVDLDLVRQPSGCWRGRFHRGAFDSAVTLCRPTPGPDVPPSPLAGTWSQTSGVGSPCVHIAQTGPGMFTGWSDSLEIPGRIRFSPSIPGPHQLGEDYGVLAKVHLVGGRQISLELYAYSPICCSHIFIGELSADGSTIKGDFPPGPNQFPHAASLTKLPGDSCVNPSMIPKHLPVPCPPGKKQ